MKKLAMSLAASTMLVSGLVGCNTVDDNVPENDSTIETQSYRGDRMMERTARHRGPVMDMFTRGDRAPYYQGDNGIRTQSRFNDPVQRDGRFNSTNYATDNDRANSYDRDRSMTDQRRGQTDSYRLQTQSHGYDSETAERIAGNVMKINGVRDARVVVHDTDVVVAIETSRESDVVRQEVEQRVRNLAANKDVYVVTDERAVGRIRDIDDRLRSGSTFDEVGDMFTDIVRDLGDAVTRPFR